MTNFKQTLLEKILKQQKSNLDTLVDSAIDAKEAATNEESKAENKYDTRGLEASYLAGAQAKRAEELKQNIANLEKIELIEYKNNDKINMTALIKTLLDDEEKYFFLLPTAGGVKIDHEDLTITVITQESPVGKKLIGKSRGDFFELSIKESITEYEILDFY